MQKQITIKAKTQVTFNQPAALPLNDPAGVDTAPDEIKRQE